MDPVYLFFIIGIAAALVGSFVAARLLKIDRLCAAPGRHTPKQLTDFLLQAATIANQAGNHALIPLIHSTDHKLLSLGLKLVADGQPDSTIRSTLESRFKRNLAFDKRCHGIGRTLAFLAPTLGIAGMTGAMFLALQQLEDPTKSAAGLSISVLVLLFGANLINIFIRRIPKDLHDTITHGVLSSSLIIEGTCALSRGVHPSDLQVHLNRILLNDAPAPARLAA